MYALQHAGLISKVDVSNFSNGTYLIEVVIDGKSTIEKFAIIK